MSILKVIQSELNSKSKNLPWAKDVSFWPWEKLLPTKEQIKISLSDFKKNVVNIKDLEKAGVKFFDLDSSEKKLQAEALQKFIIQENETKLSLIIKSLVQNIFIIDVPAKAKVELELLCSEIPAPISVYLNIGESAQVVLKKYKHISGQPFLGTCFVLAQKNSRTEFYLDNKSKSNIFAFYEAYLQAGADFHFIFNNRTNSAYTYNNVLIKHLENGSTGKITVADRLAQKSNSYFFIANEHSGQKTTGDIALKILARKDAKAKIDGWIKIGEKAVETDSYLQEDVLLLSDSSEVKAEPNLEILNNDVKASHGATLGFLDEDQMVYLMSRGFSKKQAETIIADGFLRSLSGRISSEEIKSKFLL